MRKRFITSIAVLLLIAASALPTTAMVAGDGSEGQVVDSDDLSHPLGDRQRELRERAREAQVRGKTDNRVAEVEGDSVELAAVGLDQLFVLLGEFGDQIDPTYGGTPGPQHNEIPMPDRRVDNSTIWQADYNLAHYEDMYFNQMLNYYIDQSSGLYSFGGAVHDWVQVPYNSARYGNNDCRSSVCDTVWDFLVDSADAWYAEQLAAGMTPTRSPPMSSSSIFGIAMTGMATATSTNPMGTSTTCRRSMPESARRPEAASRARTPSGAIAGTRSSVSLEWLVLPTVRCSAGSSRRHGCLGWRLHDPA